MNVEHLMTRPVATCHEMDTLNRAAQLMWDHDCGAIPIVDDEGRPIAMITDRDICVAAYTQGKLLSQIPVSAAMSKSIVTCNKREPLATAESLMQTVQVRRLPIVDDDSRLVGMLSLNDIARRGHLKKHAGSAHDDLGANAIANTLSAICAPSKLELVAE